ncbi:MAG: hypothetical protein ACLQU3_26185 [Limisphaerales bacterium]
MKKRNDLSLTQKATQALTEAVAKVVEEHRRRGIPLAVWRNGRAVPIPASEAGVLRETPTPYGRKAKI